MAIFFKNTLFKSFLGDCSFCTFTSSIHATGADEDSRKYDKATLLRKKKEMPQQTSPEILEAIQKAGLTPAPQPSSTETSQKPSSKTTN